MSDIFFIILKNILPLYTLIFLGYVAAKLLNIQTASVGNLLIYIFAPAVVFLGVAKSEVSQLSLPLVVFVFCCTLSLCVFFVSKKWMNSPKRNILAFMSGSGNTGYFGIPVVIYILGDPFLSLAVLATFGVILFENTLGFYLTAKGSFSLKESLRKVICLPTVYAFFCGLLFAIFKWPVEGSVLSVLSSIKGAYIVLGMMIIGMTMAKVKVAAIDTVLLTLSFVIKFILWPVLMLLLISLDNTYSKFFAKEIHQVLLLLSLVPLPANAVALATVLKAEPEKTSVAVALSTLMALFTIPLSLLLIGKIN